MRGYDCTAEDYSAWRREQVEEAANLSRYLSYNDFADWHKRQDIQAEVDMPRAFDRQGVTRYARQVVVTVSEALTHALAHLQLRRSHH